MEQRVKTRNEKRRENKRNRKQVPYASSVGKLDAILRKVIAQAAQDLPLLKMELSTVNDRYEVLRRSLFNSRRDMDTEHEKKCHRIAEICAAVAAAGSSTPASLLDDFKLHADRTAHKVTQLHETKDAHDVALAKLETLKDRVDFFEYVSEATYIDLSARGRCVACGIPTENGKQACTPTHADLEAVLSLQSKLSRIDYPLQTSTPGSLERALGFTATLQRWSATDGKKVDCYLATDQAFSTYPAKYSVLDGKRAVMIPVQNVHGTVRKDVSFDSLVEHDPRFGALFPCVDDLLAALHKLHRGFLPTTSVTPHFLVSS